MTFMQLSLILIIFLLIFPIKIRKPDNIKFYDDYSLKLRSVCMKIYTFFYLVTISFYILAFILILFYPEFYKKII